MEQGILDALPEAAVIKLPVADGGEGTVDVIVNAAGGRYYALEVAGPLGEPVMARFGVVEGPRQTFGGADMVDGADTVDGSKDTVRTAVIEMSSASGLTLVPKERLNPLAATTYGTGQLIKAALDQGCRRILIGIGGSATNDGGAGMAQALGVRFLDAGGKELPFGGGSLGALNRIDITRLDPRITECEIIVGSDVGNPLCGPSGASAVFGPQKGAKPEMVRILDASLYNYGTIIREQLGVDVLEVPGAGAAGGLGAGLLAFLSARMRRGIDIVLEAIQFEKHTREADLVITGEGRTDAQTAYGKAPAGVAALAKRYNKPVVCISGGVGPDADALLKSGIDVIVGAVQLPMTLEEAMGSAAESIRYTVAHTMRTLLIPGKYFTGTQDDSR
ncbi:glycerate kinase [Paenibacillus agaridevorans]|uniref:Glycerate kinase n=2 Tax=Paenibacillus agaridevorans TaxID=171404 RepID=A0A2R5F3M8_9BACL|nr:glycerate kinase [Paenibacillus agaridevorans]